MAELDNNANTLLAALLRNAPASWRNEIEQVDLPLGTVLHEPFERRDQVFFPVTAVVSLLCVMEDGETAEVAVVGREGVVGLSMFLADGMTPNRGVVQCAGTAIRLRASAIRQEILRNGRVADVLLRFTQALITQMAQTAGCNRHHAIDQHLCRWILMMLDRHSGNVIIMTHELIATMLGVRRESVSTAAARLQRLGLITYLRGRITVLDRVRIEALACECYGVVRDEYDRLLPPLPAAAPSPDAVDAGTRLSARRLDTLRAIGILDSPAELAYDTLARHAAARTAAPYAIVNMLDAERDWFKASIGFDGRESPAETSFCSVFFQITDDTIVVPDTRTDKRFASHPFVRGMPFIRFYAAVRLVLAGHTVGTLCVYDMKARTLDKTQVAALQALGLETSLLLQGRMGAVARAD